MFISTFAETVSQNWLVSLLAFGLAAILGQTIYAVYFHPLSKVPGPLLCKVSYLPSFYHACKGDRHIWLWQLFQVYGDTIRPEPNKVLFNDPEAYFDIFNFKSNIQKSNFYTAYIRNKDRGHTLVTIDKELHAKKRRLLNYAFTEKSTRSAEKFIIQHVDRWHELIATGQLCNDGKSGILPASKGWSGGLNMTNALDALVFDIIGDLCYGKSFEIKEPGENSMKLIPHAITQYAEFYYPIVRSPIRPLLLWLKPRGFDNLINSISPPEVKAFYQFMEDNVARRIKSQAADQEKPDAAKRLDILHYLLEAKDPDTGKPAYDEVDLRTEAELITIAGSDTVATVLAGIFFYLSRNPEKCAKVAKEIREAFPTVDEITDGRKLRSCTYFVAAVREGMRLTPPGTSELERQVGPGGAIINGQFFPGGTFVGVAGWSATRSEVSYGSDAQAYRPERWIPDGETGVTEESVNRIRRYFHPFLEGPGNCAGQAIAMVEIYQTVARTLHRFDIQRTESTVGEGAPEKGWGRRNPNVFQVRDAYIATRDGPFIQFRSA